MHCEPRIAVVPDGRVRHAGPQITRLAEMGGICLDEAQRYLAEVTSGTGADGRWLAYEAVIFAPRQNLKTEFLIARILAGLFLFGEDYIVYSAHEGKTTRKTFGRLKRAIARHPELGSAIARVSNRAGAETIELTTGQTLECVARSTNSGRGFTGNTVILDEAHELDRDMLAAMSPMLSTIPNPQIIYALSLGNDHSSHLGGLRARALDGKPGVCWVEWSLDDDDDPADRAVWARCNPAVPARIEMAFLEKQFASLGPDLFAREHLGRSSWPTGEPGQWQVFSEEDWLRMTTDENGNPWTPETVGRLVPVAAQPAPVPEFDPFVAWPPDGVPPWVAGAATAPLAGVLTPRRETIESASAAGFRVGNPTAAVRVPEVEGA